MIGFNRHGTSCVWGLLHWEVPMTYEKPEVRDFGSIAEHTYNSYGWFSDWFDCDPGGSGRQGEVSL